MKHDSTGEVSGSDWGANTANIGEQIWKTTALSEKFLDIDDKQ